jgi:hypothetical protein
MRTVVVALTASIYHARKASADGRLSALFGAARLR